MSCHWSFLPASELAAHADTWNQLNRAAGDLPFLDTAFLLPLLRHFGRGGELLALARSGGDVVAGALLQRDGMGRVRTFQPSQLPLGPWLAAPGHDAWDLARQLLHELPGLTLGLGLTQLDPRFTPRPAQGPLLQSLDYIDTAWVDVQGSFEAYWEARGKNLKTNMRKQRSKLESEGVTLHFGTLRAPQDMAAAVAAYGQLEAKGWKSESGTAVLPDNAQGRLYREALEAFAAQGRARVWQLRFDERVVAMDLCVESDAMLVVLKTAFDPEFRTVSPAFLLRQDAFRQVFEEQRHARIEFYGRVMEWHTRWTEQARTLYHGNLYRWALVPRLHRQLQRLRSKPAPAAPEAAAG